MDNLLLRQSLFQIMGREKKSDDIFGIGTAFCVSVFDDAALLLTAGHIINEIFAREKGPFKTDLNCPFPPPNPRETKRSEIFILFKCNNGSIVECPLINVTSWRAFDVACIWVKIPDKLSGEFIRWRIDTRPPEIDTKVCMSGYSVQNRADKLIEVEIHRESGKVQNVFMRDNFNKANAPYIRTDIPIYSGCSGSPLIDSKTSCVIGIASHDSQNTKTNKADGENSVFTPILPALGIAIPPQIVIADLPRGKWSESLDITTGFDLVADGLIEDISKCHEHVKPGIIKDGGLAINFKWQFDTETHD